VSGYDRDEIEVDFEQEGVGWSRKTEVGGMTIAFERWNGGLDTYEMFKDLPDGACQEQHWGHVLNGRATVKYTRWRDDETIAAGQAYYLAPGHNVVVEETLELLEFTPADQSPDQKPPPGA
jgi:hypothetical protein